MFLARLTGSRLAQQADHLAYHAKLYKTGSEGEPKGTTYQEDYQQVAPEDVGEGVDNVHSFIATYEIIWFVYNGKDRGFTVKSQQTPKIVSKPVPLPNDGTT
jgi:hypothetical protein